jgi:hypothetical protein
MLNIIKYSVPITLIAISAYGKISVAVANAKARKNLSIEDEGVRFEKATLVN